MPSLVKSLHTASAALAAIVPLAAAVPAGVYPRNVTAAPKIILDNDWSVAGFITYLLPLASDWDVLGLVSDTADSWALQTGLHALATLEVGNLSCIPVYKGSDYPLIQTEERFQAWEAVHGVLPWEGVFAKENLTYEAEGNDPTSGNPDRVSRAAFFEGFPNTTFASDTNAANFMVEQVKKYPGEVSIYSGGALTNIALAVRMDPDFAKNAKELVIMGGYIDVNLLQTTGSVMQADLNSDVRSPLLNTDSRANILADQPHCGPRGGEDRADGRLSQHHDCRQRRQPGHVDAGVPRRGARGAERLLGPHVQLLRHRVPVLGRDGCVHHPGPQHCHQQHAM